MAFSGDIYLFVVQRLILIRKHGLKNGEIAYFICWIFKFWNKSRSFMTFRKTRRPGWRLLRWERGCWSAGGLRCRSPRSIPRITWYTILSPPTLPTKLKAWKADEIRLPAAAFHLTMWELIGYNTNREVYIPIISAVPHSAKRWPIILSRVIRPCSFLLPERMKTDWIGLIFLILMWTT